VTTKAWLEGHQFDLAVLAAQLGKGDVRVEYDDGANAYYLTAPKILIPADVNHFDVPARWHLRNGSRRPTYGPCRPY
jgi:hypothetical protein